MAFVVLAVVHDRSVEFQLHRQLGPRHVYMTRLGRLPRVPRDLEEELGTVRNSWRWVLGLSSRDFQRFRFKVRRNRETGYGNRLDELRAEFGGPSKGG